MTRRRGGPGGAPRGGDTPHPPPAHRGDPESAHAAFLEAARLLREASSGTPVLELEWAVIHTLMRDAAELFDDLPLVSAPPASVPLPRRWWQRRTRVRQVDQKYLAVHVAMDAAERGNRPDPLFEITSFLLGRDAVLRVAENYVRGERNGANLPRGWLPPDDARLRDLIAWDVASTSHPLLLNEIEMEEAERVLGALDRVAVLTRDRVAARLQRLREREHL
jgi:hypothetical protein